MAKKIFFQHDKNTLSIAKLGVKKAGIIIGTDVPSGNVTVSFSSLNGFFTVTSSLVFTAGNYLTPQPITITALDNAIVEGFKTDTIVMSCSGGGYDGVTKNIEFNICDAGLDYQFLRGWNWYPNIKTKNTADIASKRAIAIDHIFDGNGIPINAVPTDIVVGHTGAMGQTDTSSITGVDAWDRLIFNISKDGYDWPSVVYHGRKAGNTKIAFVCGGHGSEGNHVQAIQERIDAGQDVIYCFMPCTFDSQNRTLLDTSAVSALTLHPGAWPSRGVGAHGNLFTTVPLVETVSYSALKLFYFDKFMAKNYIKANYGSITKFFFTGCSGGGYTAVRICAMDTEFSAGVDVRGGAKDHKFRAFSDESSPANWDFEQGGVTSEGGILNTTNQGPYIAALDAQVTVFDWLALASSGGRKFRSMTHVSDSCCHNKYTYSIWKDFIRSYYLTLGCDYKVEQITDPSFAVHGWRTPDLAIIDEIFV